MTDFAVRCVPGKDVRARARCGSPPTTPEEARGARRRAGDPPPLRVPARERARSIRVAGDPGAVLGIRRSPREARARGRAEGPRVRAGGGPVAGTKVELVFGGGRRRSRAGSPRSASSTRTSFPADAPGRRGIDGRRGRSRAEGAEVRGKRVDPRARPRSPAHDPGPDRMERGPIADRDRRRRRLVHPRHRGACGSPRRMDATRRSETASLPLHPGRGRTPTPSREPRASAPGARGSSR